VILETFEKQVNDVKDYDIDYSTWLPTGDTISVVTETDPPTCLNDATDTALVIDSVAATTTSIKVWMSAGTAGYTYKLTLLVTTAGGRDDEIELIFNVVND